MWLMRVTVFYSWQSDLPNNTNRGFIQRALEKAIASIKSQEELVIDPCLERDTAGVSGSPDIASTIFRKIDASHVFVGDVSIINPKARTSRKTPNPNVLLELGYAAKTLTWDNVICVFNAAYGKTEDLPFDLRLRRMALYSVKEEEELKTEERDKLATVFQSALQPMLLRLNEQVKEEKTPRPLTPDEMTAKVKECLADDRQRIHLSDLVMSIGNELAHSIVGSEYPVQVPREIVEDTFRQRMGQFEDMTQAALSIVVAGCYWGTQANQRLWTDLVQRASNVNGEGAGFTALLNLRRYPALLLFVAGGIAAVAGDNYDTLMALLSGPKILNYRTGSDESPLTQLSYHRVFDPQLLNEVIGQRWYAPVSEHLFKLLRDPFRHMIPDERGYEICFDRYEYLRCLAEADMTNGPRSFGRFGWRWQHPETDVMAAIEAEEKQLGNDWPLYKAGLFGGSRERFLAAKATVAKAVAQLAWH